MKQLAELLPVVIFFVVYRLDGTVLALGDWHYTVDGIYSATAALMLATTLQVVLTRLLSGHLEKRLLLLFGVVMVFGGATLLLHDQTFIQWKPTIFNWALAGVFVGARLFGGKTALERTMGEQLQLPAAAWRRLDWLWTANFVIVGALNLVVAYRFSESAWVSYKLYSSIGFTLLLTALTVLLIMPHIRDEPPGKPAEPG